MAKLKGLTFLIAGCVLLSGCSGDKSYNDLQNYMQEIKSRPVGEIEPLPTFRSHKTFRYGAIAMRSPFDAPLIAGSAESVAGKSTVEPPSENRKKNTSKVSTLLRYPWWGFFPGRGKCGR